LQGELGSCAVLRDWAWRSPWRTQLRARRRPLLLLLLLLLLQDKLKAHVALCARVLLHLEGARMRLHLNLEHFLFGPQGFHLHLNSLSLKAPLLCALGQRLLGILQKALHLDRLAEILKSQCPPQKRHHAT
jgi:hypothetical protein